ncbi:MAG: hypothetical protein AAB837_02935, partial [Patescibacteria group bacterium]
EIQKGFQTVKLKRLGFEMDLMKEIRKVKRMLMAIEMEIQKGFQTVKLKRLGFEMGRMMVMRMDLLMEKRLEKLRRWETGWEMLKEKH